MKEADTSAAAVERLAAFHTLSADRYCADEESGLRACAVMTAATLRALLAEREEAIDQRNAADFVLALSIEQSTRHSVERDAARVEVERLREEVAAREAAARREGIEAAIEIVERTISPWSIAASDECAAAIRALLEDGR